MTFQEITDHLERRAYSEVKTLTDGDVLKPDEYDEINYQATVRKESTSAWSLTVLAGSSAVTLEAFGLISVTGVYVTHTTGTTERVRRHFPASHLRSVKIYPDGDRFQHDDDVSDLIQTVVCAMFTHATIARAAIHRRTQLTNDTQGK